MPSGWDITRGVARLTRGASKATSNAINAAAQNQQLARGRRAASHGVIGPGDPPPPPGSSDHYDYRGVATGRELAGLADGWFPLGTAIDVKRRARQPIGIPDSVLRRHAAVVGPTGSGKTKSVLLPWAARALQAGGSVVLIDVSGDMLDDLAVVRRYLGPFNARVAKWDYTDASGSVSWNWIASLRDQDAVVSVTEALVGRERPNDPQPFFHQRDRRTLRGLLEVVQATRPTITSAELVGLIQDQRGLSQLCDHVSSSAGARRLADVLSMPAHEYGRAVSGVVNALEALDHPGVVGVTNRNQLDLDDLFENPALLVVVAPLAGSRTSEIVGSLMLSQIIRTLYKRFNHQRGTHAFLMIDEAPRLKARINYEELVSVSRRARVSVCLAAQDVTQFGDEQERTAVLSNCNTYISLPTTSEANGKYFASRLGQRQSSSVGFSHSVGGPGAQHSVTHSLQSTEVLGLREIMDPPWGARTALVHSPELCAKPFLVDLSRDDLGHT